MVCNGQMKFGHGLFTSPGSRACHGNQGHQVIPWHASLSRIFRKAFEHTPVTPYGATTCTCRISPEHGFTLIEHCIIFS